MYRPFDQIAGARAEHGSDSDQFLVFFLNQPVLFVTGLL
jgi:hypothetical protein